MIGIDTNILLRLWLNDDPAPDKRIDALLAAHGGMPGSLLLTDVVLAEAVRTLKPAFEQDKHAQLIAVRSPLEEIAFALEDREAVAAALSLFEAGSADSPTAWPLPSMPCRVANSPLPSTQRMHKLPGVKAL